MARHRARHGCLGIGEQGGLLQVFHSYCNSSETSKIAKCSCSDDENDDDDSDNVDDDGVPPIQVIHNTMCYHMHTVIKIMRIS